MMSFIQEGYDQKVAIATENVYSDIVLKTPKSRRLRRPGKPVVRAHHNPHSAGSRGNPIRVRRHDLGVTIAELASRTGLTWMSIWRIEQGRQMPRPGTMRKILVALKGDQPGRSTGRGNIRGNMGGNI